MLGIENDCSSFNFPIGTMFWAKQGALRSLYDLNIKWEDFPKEPIDYDGTILHAIERLLPFIAMKNGYTECLTHVEGVYR